MIIGLVGPTCVGKTSVSLELAKARSAEIVSVDSRQIYREISIGTAKPSKVDLAAVRHHFIDERSIDDPISAGQFADAAHARISDIESRGNNVLLVGGSTLYLHALLFGLDEIPAVDPKVRVGLGDSLKEKGLETLVAELANVDPVSHERLDLSNPRRVLRALEVYYSTGRPLSSFQRNDDRTLDATIFVLNRERPDLYRRIDKRVEEMVADGLVDELKAILEEGFSSKLQALQTIGYQEIVDFLSGKSTLREAVALIQRNTRRYAKRQLTWFRRYDGFEWIDIDEQERVTSICSRLLHALEGEASGAESG